MTNPLNKIKNAPKPLKASIAYIVCSILQKSLSFITMPLFTSILTKAEYGQFTIYTSWEAILTILITLNLAFGSFGHAMMKYETKRDEYVSSIQSLVFLFALLIICIYLPFSSFFNNLLELSTNLVLLMIAEILATFGLQCWLGIKRYQYKYISVVIITLLMAVLSPALALLLIHYSNDKGTARILGYIIISIVFGGSIFVLNYIKGKKVYSKDYWLYALKFNLPLLVYYFSQVIFNQSDKIMIEKLCEEGLSDAAVYGVGHSIALILTFVLNAINNAYVPWLYESIKDGTFIKNRNMSLLITIVLCTLVGGVIWISPEIVTIMAGKEYLEAIYVIPPISISLILLLFSQYSINIEFYFAEKWKLVIASIGSALLNILLNLWLIPIYGFVAAGYTTMISYVVFAISNYFSIFKYIRKNGSLYRIYNFPVMLILFGAFVLISYLGVWLYDNMMARLIIVGVVILLVIVFIPKIKRLYQKLKASDNDQLRGKTNEESH